MFRRGYSSLKPVVILTVPLPNSSKALNFWSQQKFDDLLLPFCVARFTNNGTNSKALHGFDRVVMNKCSSSDKNSAIKIFFLFYIKSSLRLWRNQQFLDFVLNLFYTELTKSIKLSINLSGNNSMEVRQYHPVNSELTKLKLCCGRTW